MCSKNCFHDSTIKSSVILCTRNRIIDLLNALHSLSKQTEQPYEIIIIDSSTNPLILDNSFKSVWESGIFNSSKLVYKHTSPGLTYQRNQSIKFITGNVAYFFDDDVVLSSNYLQIMNHSFAYNTNYAGGMGTVDPLGRYKRVVNWCRALFLLQRNYSSGLFTLSGMATHAYGMNSFCTVEVLGGCCMAFRTAILQCYKFDEKLKRYGYMEDCDFSYRVSRDYQLFFNPQAVLEHRESPLARDTIKNNKAMFIANYSYLFFKNFYPHNRFKIVAYCWSIIGLFLEALIVVRDPLWIAGYYTGLRYTIRHKAEYPYGYFE